MHIILSRIASAATKAKSWLLKPMDSGQQLLFDILEERYGKGEVFREVPIGPFIVDFYVPKIHTAYELDGRGHTYKIERDIARDKNLFLFAELSVIRIPRGITKKGYLSIIQGKEGHHAE